MSFFVAELGTLFFVQESDQSKNYEKNSSDAARPGSW